MSLLVFDIQVWHTRSKAGTKMDVVGMVESTMDDADDIGTLRAAETSTLDTMLETYHMGTNTGLLQRYRQQKQPEGWWERPEALNVKL